MADRLLTAKDLLRHEDKLTQEDREELFEWLKIVMSDPKGEQVPAKKKLIDLKLKGTAIQDAIESVIAKTIAELTKP